MMVNRKKGQLTLFVVLAIIIVIAGVAGFLIYRSFDRTTIPGAAQPVYGAYLSCIEGLAEEGVKILGSQGGHLEPLEFEPGSPFMPSSSHLDFLGVGVPYWFFVSGNNIIKEQVPTMRGMELELQQFIQENLQSCDFSDFESRGYLVDVDKGGVEVEIKDNQIFVEVKNELRVSFEEDFFRFREHKVEVKSKFGKFYSLAMKIYDKEKTDSFLGNYALDTLFLNAPTVGFEEGCTPIIFNFNEIRGDVAQALSANIASVKTKGNYYSNLDEYYIADLGINVNEDVNFLYSTQWPTKIEIYGDEFAEPVGLQPGVSTLGFCFVDYHLIYDLVFPVLIQIVDERELFQFPIVILIERNQLSNNKIVGNSFGTEDVICKNKNQDISIEVNDLNFNPVDATISFSCLGERCYLGETKSIGGKSVLDTKIPMCVNGFIEARAEGYSAGKYMVSSNSENSAEVLIKKIHEVSLNLGNIKGNALVQFSSEEYSTAILYPSNNKVGLVEGIYDVKVQVFQNSSLVLPARTEKKCFEIPSTGLGALVGSTENSCFEITIPSQTIDQALIGGGNSVEYFDDFSLSEGNEILIDVPLFSVPSKLEEVNENYIKLEDSVLRVSLG